MRDQGTILINNARAIAQETGSHIDGFSNPYFSEDRNIVVVSESTGRVTLFEEGRVISTLEPVISRRLV
ncbi:MAG: hypothetical protein AB1805_05195 [Nitrospirota bacterium]